MASRLVDEVLNMSPNELREKVEYAIYAVSKWRSLKEDNRNRKRGKKELRRQRGKPSGLYKTLSGEEQYIDEEEDDYEPNVGKLIGTNFLNTMQSRGKTIPYIYRDVNNEVYDIADDFYNEFLTYASSPGKGYANKFEKFISEMRLRMARYKLPYKTDSPTFQAFCVLVSSTIRPGFATSVKFQRINSELMQPTNSAAILLLIAMGRGFDRRMTEETKLKIRNQFIGLDEMSQAFYSDLTEKVADDFTKIPEKTLEFIRTCSEGTGVNPIDKEELDALNEHREGKGKKPHPEKLYRGQPDVYEIDGDDDDNDFIAQYRAAPNLKKKREPAPEAAPEPAPEAAPEAAPEPEPEADDKDLNPLSSYEFLVLNIERDDKKLPLKQKQIVDGKIYVDLDDFDKSFIKQLRGKNKEPVKRTPPIYKEELAALNKRREKQGKPPIVSEKKTLKPEPDDDDLDFILQLKTGQNLDRRGGELPPDSPTEAQPPQAPASVPPPAEAPPPPPAQEQPPPAPPAQAVPDDGFNPLQLRETYVLNGERARRYKPIATSKKQPDGSYIVELDDVDKFYLTELRKGSNVEYPDEALPPSRFNAELQNAPISQVVTTLYNAMNEMTGTLSGVINTGNGNIAQDIIDALPGYKSDLKYIYEHLFAQYNDVIKAVSMGQRVFDTVDGIVTDGTVFYSTNGITIGQMISTYTSTAQLFNRVVQIAKVGPSPVHTEVKPNYLFTIIQNGRFTGVLQSLQQGGSSVSERQTLYSVERRRIMNELVSKGLLKLENSKELVDPNTGLPLFDQFGQKIYENSYSYLGVPVSEKEVNDMINNFLMRKFLNQSRSFFTQIDLEQLRLKNLKKKTVEKFKRDVKMRGVTSQPKPVNNQDIYRGTASQGMRLNPNISIYRR